MARKKKEGPQEEPSAPVESEEEPVAAAESEEEPVAAAESEEEPSAPAEGEEKPVAPAEGEEKEEPTVEPSPPARPPLTEEEERRAAAIAHGSVLLNLLTGIGGPVVALIVWLLYDKKSEYVGWHALQALVFQGISLLLTLVFGGIAALLWTITAPLLIMVPDVSKLVVGFCFLPFTLGFTLIAALLVIGTLIYGCTGALAVLEGQEFRYRWVADIIPPLTKP